MAVDAKGKHPAPTSAGRRMMMGTNVFISVALVVGIVVVLQALAFEYTWRADMTSSSINSLSEGTENLVSTLESNVTLTSLYFETDRETEDQPRYRRAIDDLLDLYEAGNRSKVKSQWINPLKDHEKYKNLVARLRESPAFQGEIAQYKDRITAYTQEGVGLDARLKALIAGELQQIRALGGPMSDDATKVTIAPVEMLLQRWDDELRATREAVDKLTSVAGPQYTAASNELKSMYRSLSESLKNIAAHGAEEVRRKPTLAPAAIEYLSQCGQRYADVSGTIERESEALQSLERPKLDDILTEIRPQNNAVLVETTEGVEIVDFSTAWPALDPNAGMNADFFNRAFKGEEQLTAAILRATHKEQTAVIFVRYGGTPLFMGAMVPGQPPSPYRMMKEQMEVANFLIKEWDLKTSDTPPAIDPPPTRSIYVVLKPVPPQRGPMGQPSQEPPFSDGHRQALLRTMGDSGRALFIAGWAPGPFGPIPGAYEYGDYLKSTWGIDIDTSALLIRLGTIAPGRYYPTQRDFFALREVELSGHDIVSGPQMPFAFPWCAPLSLAETPPEGVELSALVTQPARDGVWGVHNIQDYEAQLGEKKYMTRLEEDLEGPFMLAAAAAKGDAKVVVVSSRGFAEDGTAFARGIVAVGGGIQLRTLNPGNPTLLINSLHWLNDNTDFLNVGRPIDLSVLTIDRPSTITMIQVLTIVVWPALALVGGGAVWWVRRR